MHRFIGWLGAGVLAGLIMLGSVIQADDKDKEKPKAQKLTPDKIPQKVMAAIKGRFPGADITAAEREVEDGNVVYDIELTHQGRKYEMDIKEDGTIIEIEKEIKLKDLSEAVAKAVKAKYPKATIVEIMEVNKVKGKQETPDHYEIVIETADKKKMELEVSLDGKSIKAGSEGEKK